MSTALGTALKRARESKAGTDPAFEIRAFALRLGYDPNSFSMVQQFENGRIVPKHEMLEEWAKLCYVDEDTRKTNVAEWEWLAAMDYGRKRWSAFQATEFKPPKKKRNALPQDAPRQSPT